MLRIWFDSWLRVVNKVLKQFSRHIVSSLCLHRTMISLSIVPSWLALTRCKASRAREGNSLACSLTRADAHSRAAWAIKRPPGRPTASHSQNKRQVDWSSDTAKSCCIRFVTTGLAKEAPKDEESCSPESSRVGVLLRLLRRRGPGDASYFFKKNN